jgi:putative FmdB family regulatory protein
VATYDYVCEECGVFEVVRQIGTAAAQERCPRCGCRAARVFSPPALTSPKSPLHRAREAADRSAHEPVVSRRPSSPPRRARPANPLHARLPRP